MALVREIIFVDGENLVFRYQAMLKDGHKPRAEVVHVPDQFVWNNAASWNTGRTDLLRINYYTSAVGAPDVLEKLCDFISRQKRSPPTDYYGGGQLVPRVFAKPAKSHKSRLVDST